MANEPLEPCVYHSRPQCKACHALSLALRAEGRSPNIMERKLTEAVECEARGE